MYHEQADRLAWLFIFHDRTAAEIESEWEQAQHRRPWLATLEEREGRVTVILEFLRGFEAHQDANRLAAE